MLDSMFHSIAPQFIQTYNVSRTISETTAAAMTSDSLAVVEQTAMISNNLQSTNPDISPIACFGFVVLILTTVGGNSLVLLALLLEKRLHSPSFYLIANMAIADLLLGKHYFSSSFYFRKICILSMDSRFSCPTVFICTRVTQRSMDIWTRFLFSLACFGCTLLYSFDHRTYGCID